MRSVLCAVALVWMFPFTGSTPVRIQTAGRYIFPTHADKVNEDGEPITSYGTAFCRPGSASNELVTAGHVPQSGLYVVDHEGNGHVVMVWWQDEVEDVAVLFLPSDDALCALNSLVWAKSSGPIGSDVWLVGYPAGAKRLVHTRGVMSSEADFLIEDTKKLKSLRASDVLAIPGESGAPLFDEQGAVIGLLHGAYGSQQGRVTAFVPIETIRRVLK